jgi:protein-disulfide isomerase
MSKQFLAIVGAVFVLFIAIFISSTHKAAKTLDSKTAAAATQHIEGNTASNVHLVEYGDFQCPYCEQYYATIQTVAAQYKDKITFQFRNFPLVNNHPNAFAAARAAEAAALQNKYWEMHDTLYNSANWSTWTTSSSPTELFNGYAKQLGLNVTQFKTDYASIKVNDAINADTAAGTALNITGTPSFYLNGKQVQIGNTVEAFSKILDAAIAKAKPAASATPTSNDSMTPSTSTDTPAATDPAATAAQ